MSHTQKPSGKLNLGDKWLEFVGEGAANTIWAVNFVSNSGGDESTKKLRRDCDGFLLRIQKDLSDGSDSNYTAKDQLAYLEKSILPIFNNQTDVFVRHKLIELPQEVIDECNHILAQLDGNYKASNRDDALPHAHLPIRARKFVETRVGPAGWHMLTEDMRARGPNERFAEIKPKWLAQSPAAPTSAVLCRNCAVAAQRFSDAPEGRKPSKSDPAKYGCPLRLVAGPGPTRNDDEDTANRCKNGMRPSGDEEQQDDDAWKPHAERIFRSQEPSHAHFLFWTVRQHHLLRFLRDQQHRLAGPGPDAHDAFWSASSRDQDPYPDLFLSMTLRDCSLFFRYEVRPTDGALRMLDFKLADLDRKNPSKIPSWQETERRLVEAGWYEGKQAEKGEVLPRCFLREKRHEGAVPESLPVDMTKLKEKALLGVLYKE